MVSKLSLIRSATIYEDRDAAEHLADDCIWEANTRGVTEAALIEAAGSDLNEHMLAKLSREVENHLRATEPARNDWRYDLQVMRVTAMKLKALI